MLNLTRTGTDLAHGFCHLLHLVITDIDLFPNLIYFLSSNSGTLRIIINLLCNLLNHMHQIIHFRCLLRCPLG